MNQKLIRILVNKLQNDHFILYFFHVKVIYQIICHLQSKILKKKNIIAVLVAITTNVS